MDSVNGTDRVSVIYLFIHSLLPQYIQNMKILQKIQNVQNILNMNYAVYINNKIKPLFSFFWLGGILRNVREKKKQVLSMFWAVRIAHTLRVKVHVSGC